MKTHLRAYSKAAAIAALIACSWAQAGPRETPTTDFTSASILAPGSSLKYYGSPSPSQTGLQAKTVFSGPYVGGAKPLQILNASGVALSIAITTGNNSWVTMTGADGIVYAQAKQGGGSGVANLSAIIPGSVNSITITREEGSQDLSAVSVVALGPVANGAVRVIADTQVGNTSAGYYQLVGVTDQSAGTCTLTPINVPIYASGDGSGYYAGGSIRFPAVGSVATQAEAAAGAQGLVAQQSSCSP